MKIDEVMGQRIRIIANEDAQGFKSNKEQQAAARKQVDWHKEQARKYDGKDGEEGKAGKLHKQLSYEYVKLAQEYFYGNNTIAERLAKQIQDEIAKNEIVAADVKAYKK